MRLVRRLFPRGCMSSDRAKGNDPDSTQHQSAGTFAGPNSFLDQHPSTLPPPPSTLHPPTSTPTHAASLKQSESSGGEG